MLNKRFEKISSTAQLRRINKENYKAREEGPTEGEGGRGEGGGEIKLNLILRLSLACPNHML